MNTRDSIEPTPPLSTVPNLHPQKVPASVYDRPAWIEIAPSMASYYALMHRPNYISRTCIEGLPGSWGRTEAVTQDIMSRAKDISISRYSFMGELNRLQILAPQEKEQGQCLVPHQLLDMFNQRANLERITTRMTQGHPTVEEALVHLQRVEDDLALAQGIADIALLHALDTCAMLAGYELPTWSAQPHWRGAYIHPHCFTNRPPSEQEGLTTSRIIRTFERWGVPMWCFIHNSARQRLDLGADGLATLEWNGETEEKHQILLRGLGVEVTRGRVAGYQSFTIVGRAVVDVPESGHPLGALPSGPNRTQLESMVLDFLDPTRTTSISLDVFSSEIKKILPPGVWTGQRHEAHLHSAQFVVGQHERWTAVRESFLGTAHLPAIYSIFEVPPMWYNARLRVHDAAGESSIPTTIINVTPVPLRQWSILEVDDFTRPGREMDDVQDLGLENQAYGWAQALSPVQRKDAAGKTVPKSRYLVRLAFKLESHRDLFAQHPKLQEKYSFRSVNEENFQPHAYNWNHHPKFIELAYFHSTTLAGRSRLLAVAPSYNMVNISENDPNARSIADKNMIHRLRFTDLLECDSYPPVPVLGPSLPKRAQDACTTTIDTLLKIAFSTAEDDTLLSTVERCALQRSACIMKILSDVVSRPSFLTQIFSSMGPYEKVARYICSVIRNYQSTPGNSFVGHERRQGISPFYESIHLTNNKNIVICLRLDSLAIESPTVADVMRHQERVEASRQLLFTAKQTTAEQRRAKRQKTDINPASGSSSV